MLDRTAETYVALLAVMKAGATFVPLATAFPEERMMLIIEDANIGLIVTISDYSTRVEKLPVPHVLIDDVAAEITAKSDAPLQPSEVRSSSDDPCYILYTSGTTGRPKGVVIRHQSICNFVRVAAAAYGYRPGDRVYQGMTIAFDFSVEEIWVPFVAGATIVPAPGRIALVGEELADFLRVNDITCMAAARPCCRPSKATCPACGHCWWAARPAPTISWCAGQRRGGNPQHLWPDRGDRHRDHG